MAIALSNIAKTQIKQLQDIQVRPLQNKLKILGWISYCVY